MGLFDKIKSAVTSAVQPTAPQPTPQKAAPPPPPPAAAAKAPEPEPEPEPEEEAAEGDFKRDYALEAKDDAARFDIRNDLAPYYTAEFRIEQAWDDVSARRALFGEYGIRDEPHFYQVRATVQRYIESPAAQQKYGGTGEIMHVKMKATQDYMMGGMQKSMQSGALKGEVEPVEGVTLQQWAGCQAKVASGGNVDDIIRGAGLDRAKWDRVSAEWNARMSRDTTATIATAYGQAFMAGAGGQFSAAAQQPGQGEPPISLDKYCEISEAQSAGSAQGKDASQILKSFGLSIVDWSSVGAWWSAYINANAMKNNGKLLNEFNELSAKYKAKYKAGSADGDISF